MKKYNKLYSRENEELFKLVCSSDFCEEDLKNINKKFRSSIRKIMMKTATNLNKCNTKTKEIQNEISKTDVLKEDTSKDKRCIDIDEAIAKRRYLDEAWNNFSLEKGVSQPDNYDYEILTKKDEAVVSGLKTAVPTKVTSNSKKIVFVDEVIAKRNYLDEAWNNFALEKGVSTDNTYTYKDYSNTDYSRDMWNTLVQQQGVAQTQKRIYETTLNTIYQNIIWNPYELNTDDSNNKKCTSENAKELNFLVHIWNNYQPKEVISKNDKCDIDDFSDAPYLDEIWKICLPTENVPETNKCVDKTPTQIKSINENSKFVKPKKIYLKSNEVMEEVVKKVNNLVKLWNTYIPYLGSSEIDKRVHNDIFNLLHLGATWSMYLQKKKSGPVKSLDEIISKMNYLNDLWKGFILQKGGSNSQPKKCPTGVIKHIYELNDIWKRYLLDMIYASIDSEAYGFYLKLRYVNYIFNISLSGYDILPVENLPRGILEKLRETYGSLKNSIPKTDTSKDAKCTVVNEAPTNKSLPNSEPNTSVSKVTVSQSNKCANKSATAERDSANNSLVNSLQNKDSLQKEISSSNSLGKKKNSAQTPGKNKPNESLPKNNKTDVHDDIKTKNADNNVIKNQAPKKNNTEIEKQNEVVLIQTFLKNMMKQYDIPMGTLHLDFDAINETIPTQLLYKSTVFPFVLGLLTVCYKHLKHIIPYGTENGQKCFIQIQDKFIEEIKGNPFTSNSPFNELIAQTLQNCVDKTDRSSINSVLYFLSEIVCRCVYFIGHMYFKKEDKLRNYSPILIGIIDTMINSMFDIADEHTDENRERLKRKFFYIIANKFYDDDDACNESQILLISASTHRGYETLCHDFRHYISLNVKPSQVYFSKENTVHPSNIEKNKSSTPKPNNNST